MPKCRYCGLDIIFLKSSSGRWIPSNPDKTAHYCEQVIMMPPKTCDTQTSREIIEDAIFSNQNLIIDYFVEGKGSYILVVKPLLLDPQNKKFLTAFCHQIQDKRTYRVDRILHIQPLETDRFKLEEQVESFEILKHLRDEQAMDDEAALRIMSEYCPNCGATAKPPATTCPDCGMQMLEQNFRNTTYFPETVCNKCGARDETDIYCSECGHQLKTPWSAPTSNLSR